MSLINMATELFMNQLGSKKDGMDSGVIGTALQTLLPSSGGNLDIASLVGSLMNSGGLQSIVGSWLGNGSNDSISASQIMGIFGEGKVTEFASKLGLDSNFTADALSNMIPELIDKNSDSGDIVGDAAGDIAKSLLGKFGL